MYKALLVGLLVVALSAVGCAGKPSAKAGVRPPGPNGVSSPAIATGETSLRIPAALWQEGAIGQADYFSIFPRQSGQQSCSIPHGGPAPQGADDSRFPGVCSTSLGELDASSLAVVPESQRASAWRTVVLSETWTGPHSEGKNQASWVFVVSKDWRVLGVRIIDLPPQLWK